MTVQVHHCGPYAHRPRGIWAERATTDAVLASSPATLKRETVRVLRTKLVERRGQSYGVCAALGEALYVQNNPLRSTRAFKEILLANFILGEGMKHVQILAFALAAVMAGSVAADTTYSIGTLGATPYINVVTVDAGTPYTLGSTNYNFTDTYNFNVSNSFVAGTAVTIDLDLGSIGYHISNLRLDLYDVANAWLDGDMVSDEQDVMVSVDAPLTAGNYYFTLRGLADGQSTSKGIYTFTAAAIPETKTYAMLLAGLGLVGMMVRRRGRYRM